MTLYIELLKDSIAAAGRKLIKPAKVRRGNHVH